MGAAPVVDDPAMIHVYDVLRLLAPSNLTVLISGETGVGKEVAARELHLRSSRAAGPFVAINCASLPEALVESELYGYEKGAFSGATGSKAGRLETAIGGTVFLDEIGELSATAQAKLLRALETRRASRVGGLKEYELDVRVVAATNRDLQAEVQAGRFREDLYFRVNGASLTLPPLRERPRELAVFARRFLGRACAEAGRDPPLLSAQVMACLEAYRWPGNVRELKNEMEYLAATVQAPVISPEHLSERFTDAGPRAMLASSRASETQPPSAFRPLADEIRELEQRRMREALAASGGVQTLAAQLIGMPIRTFTWKYKLYALGDREARS